MAKKNLTLEEKLNEAIVKDGAYEVPGNWVWSRLGEICEKVQYGYTEKASTEKVGPHFLRITDIRENGVNWDTVPYCPISKKDYDKYKLNKGDIVIARTGATTGKNYIIDDEVDSVFASYLIRMKINKSIYNKFVSYYMYSDLYWKQIMEEQKGIAQPGVNAQKLGALIIPITPLKEQHRIVDRIESLFEKLDKAKELIEEAREGFEKRKSAVLEKAFRGELTEKWREKNKIECNTNLSKLGEIVLINPKKDKIENIDDEAECTFVPMPSVSEVSGKVETPLIEKYKKVKKGYTYFKENDVIFAKITPCMENGKSAIVSNLINGFGFGSTEFHVIRCNENVINQYIYHLLRSKMFRDRASQHMTGAVGQRRVPKNFLEEYELVLPSIEEQKEIVKILDKLLEEESKIEELTQLEDQIELIKKSILAKAFRGELGTNSEEDEGALDLLKEILKNE